MLIFDNILFATFIPQILMVLGVISCISIQFFNSSDDSKQDPTPVASIYIHSVANHTVPSCFYYFDYQQIKAKSIKSDSDETFFLKEIISFIVPRYNYNFNHFKFGFSLFSRPPPLF